MLYNLSFDNKNLKTNEMLTGKTLNREKEIPPTPPHKNPINILPIQPIISRLLKKLSGMARPIVQQKKFTFS